MNEETVMNTCTKKPLTSDIGNEQVEECDSIQTSHNGADEFTMLISGRDQSQAWFIWTYDREV